MSNTSIYCTLTITKLEYLFCSIYNTKFLNCEYFDDKFTIWYCVFRGIKKRNCWDGSKNLRKVHLSTLILNKCNIDFNVADFHFFLKSCFYWYNNSTKIKVGNTCFILPNAGIIAAIHKVKNTEIHKVISKIFSGENSWLIMIPVIQSGVILGNHIELKQSSVATKSLLYGDCINVDSPSKKIKELYLVEKQRWEIQYYED
jgi:hypothetical protein